MEYKIDHLEHGFIAFKREKQKTSWEQIHIHYAPDIETARAFIERDKLNPVHFEVWTPTSK